MSGRSANVQGWVRKTRVSQKRKADSDPEPELVVKIEPEEENNVATDVCNGEANTNIKRELNYCWEWEGDGGIWIPFSPELNTQINLSFSTGKRSVTVSPAAGVSLQVDVQKMVQKNTQSGFQRSVRLAVQDRDKYFVWQWWSDEGAWISYDACTCVALEEGFQSEAKVVPVSLGGRPYIIDLEAMVQKNSQTQYERQIQRSLSGSNSAPQQKSIISAPAKRARGSNSVRNVENESEENKEQVRTLIMKGKAPVDPECSIKLGKAHVFCEGDDVYDVMLNQGETTRHLWEHSVGEEYQHQEHFQQPQQQFQTWHSVSGLSSQHDSQMHFTGLHPPELLETGNIYMGDCSDYTNRVALTTGREVENVEIHMPYAHKKSTVWDFFHLKNPSIGIRNATSAFCNLCTREVKRGSTPGRLGTTAMRNHLAKHHQKEWAASGTGNATSPPSSRNTPLRHYAVTSTSQAPPQEQDQPLLHSVFDICYCFFATVCTLCGAVVSRGETVSANREYLMLQHMQSAHCSVLQVSLSEMKGHGIADNDSSNSS